MVRAERKTAAERREEILVAAFDEFAEHGLDGTSTDVIARKAGVSQPYVFRLFGTKKELYLETVRRCLSETLELFREASADKTGEEALDAMGMAYVGLLEDRRRLRSQMQAYADCDDEEVREIVSAGYGELVGFVEQVSGLEPERIRNFFAFGMLLNVFASMNLLQEPAPWAEQLLEACLGPASERKSR
jgi:AcrR family transcriptional regulator